MSGVYRVPDGLLGCGGEAGEQISTPAPSPGHPDRDFRLLLRLADTKLSAERIVAEAVRFVASGEAKTLAMESVSCVLIWIFNIWIEEFWYWARISSS